MTHVCNVTINASEVNSDLSDFRVYVRLSDLPSIFWSTVANGGGDIRCYKSDGTTELAREVVKCDTATETGVLWILYSGNLSSTVNTVIQIHADGVSSNYADDAAYGANAVWNSTIASFGYQAVFHLADTPTGSSGDIKNSAGTGNATSVNMGASNVVAGPFGIGGLEFNGTDEYINCGNQTWLVNNGLVTAQAIIEPDVEGVNSTIIGRWGTVSTQQSFLFQHNSTDRGALAWRNSGRDFCQLASTGDVISPNTVYALAVAAGSAMTAGAVYINGASVSSSITPDTGAIRSQGPETTIGARYDGSSASSFYNGVISEIRLSVVELSADFIDAEYVNVSTPTTFYTVSAIGGPAASIAPYYFTNLLAGGMQ